jgi:uridine kinase
MKRLLVGICGGSASGKSTLGNKIVERVGNERVAFLEQDAYYGNLAHVPQIEYEQQRFYNFDHPAAIDFELLLTHTKALLAGESIEQPVYDFATHSRTGEYRHLEPRPCILLDGILIFHLPQLRELMDLRVFVDVDPDVRFIRRLQRDIVERGRTTEFVRKQYFATVKPMHEALVLPSRQFADVIIPEMNTQADELIAAWITNRLGCKCSQ